jgi:hypothetical protein
MKKQWTAGTLQQYGIRNAITTIVVTAFAFQVWQRALPGLAGPLRTHPLDAVTMCNI